MKKKISFAIPVLALVAAAFLASCSDGEMQPQVTSSKDFSSSPPQPVVIVFAADPATVKAGESTTISWEVAGADSVKIAAVSTGEEPLAFSVDSTELKGSQTAENLTATTDFVLTATKAVAVPAEGEAKAMKAQAEETAPAPAESPSEVTVTQTITVTVTPASGISISASADSESISSGESTILHWEVVPADATVTVKDDSDTDVTPTFTGDDCSITDPSELLDSGTPTEATPSSGCAAIDPQATTTYTVSATLAGTGETQTSEVTVSVESEELSATISVNQSAEATVTNPTEAVEVSWLVSPPTALVTITAEPEVVSCTNPLPAGETVDYTSTECTLSALPTTFHIEATESGNEAMASATVSLAVLGGGEGPAVEVSASSDWAFEGEEVSVSVIASPAVAGSIREVNITDKSGTSKKIEGAPTGPVKVIVPADGVKVSVVGLDGSERTYTAVPALSTHAAPVESTQTLTSVAFDPSNSAKRYVGFMMSGYNAGKIRVIADGINPRDIPLSDLLKAEFGALGGMWRDDNMESLVKTFPVNAITVRPGKPEEVYVGATGGVFLDDFSKLGAPEEFASVMPTYLVSRNGSDYSGSHPSCRNKTQTGTRAFHSNQLTALIQICDIVIGDDGKMVVASDNGVYAIENIDKFRAKEITWEDGKPLANKVVDDLECVDSGCNTIFAATSAGVFKSVDGGKNWEDFGSFGKKAFAVVVSSDKVFAGAEDGVYASDVSSGAWTQAGLAGQITLSLAADPYPGASGATVLAGTSAGAFVTRDSGASWSAIEVAGGGEVLSVAIGSSEPVNDNRQVSVAIAAGTNFIYGEKPLSLYIKIPTLQALATQ